MTHTACPPHAHHVPQLQKASPRSGQWIALCSVRHNQVSADGANRRLRELVCIRLGTLDERRRSAINDYSGLLPAFLPVLSQTVELVSQPLHLCAQVVGVALALVSCTQRIRLAILQAARRKHHAMAMRAQRLAHDRLAAAAQRTVACCIAAKLSFCANWLASRLCLTASRWEVHARFCS